MPFWKIFNAIKEKNNVSFLCRSSEAGSKNRKRDLRVLLFILSILVLWSVFFHYYSPREVVESLGVNNVYLFVFLLAAIGGVSTFTSTTFYSTIVALAAGGADPIFLGLFASIGLTLGDLLFYYVGKKGKGCMPQRYEKYVRRLSELVKDAGDALVAIIIFGYSLTPLPSDALAITLAVSGYPLKKMVPPLLLGNFVLILIISKLSQIGFEFLI
jgi:membrane protein YqaA with SNARE-associated domain